MYIKLLLPNLQLRKSSFTELSNLYIFNLLDDVNWTASKSISLFCLIIPSDLTINNDSSLGLYKFLLQITHALQLTKHEVGNKKRNPKGNWYFYELFITVKVSFKRLFISLSFFSNNVFGGLFVLLLTNIMQHYYCHNKNRLAKKKNRRSFLLSY